MPKPWTVVYETIYAARSNDCINHFTFLCNNCKVISRAILLQGNLQAMCLCTHMMPKLFYIGSWCTVLQEVCSSTFLLYNPVSICLSLALSASSLMVHFSALINCYRCHLYARVWLFCASLPVQEQFRADGEPVSWCRASTSSKAGASLPWPAACWHGGWDTHTHSRTNT